MKILLVDADEAMVSRISGHLRRSMRTTTELRRCRLLGEALAAMQEEPWDIVLLDLALPDSSGLVGLEHILSLSSPPPVVVLTGRDDIQLALSAVSRGAQDFVRSDVAGEEELARAVLYAVERHRLKSALEAQAERLERSEANFRGIASNADGLVIVGLDARILWANLAAAGLFAPKDSGPEPLVGRLFPHAIHADQETEFEHSGRVLQMRVVETAWDGGNALLASVRDVTRRADVESQLRQAQKVSVLGRLAGGIAHDFSNVLTGLMGHADLLREVCVANTEATPHIDALIRDLAFAARLTNQLRSFGRQQVVAPQPLNLNVLISSLGPLLSGLVGEDARLEIALAPRLPAVVADPTQMEQVLLNLVSNARQATSRGGSIRIVTRPAGEAAVELRVEDDGHGMTPEILARATEAFFTTRSEDPSGGPAAMGLGLSTVGDIVERCDGDLQIRSEPGEGTRVRILLPATRQAAAVAHKSGEHSLSDRPDETILVVDDEAVIRDLLKRVLEGRGYKVLTASSGPAALDRVLGYAGRLDLLVTDVMMPEMNGRELADTLADLRPGLRVLFISGYEERILSPTGVLEPGTSFLAKPFRMKDALDAVRAVLDGSPRQQVVPAEATDDHEVITLG